MTCDLYPPLEGCTHFDTLTLAPNTSKYQCVGSDLFRHSSCFPAQSMTFQLRSITKQTPWPESTIEL
jgi:hypothetical protein